MKRTKSESSAMAWRTRRYWAGRHRLVSDAGQDLSIERGAKMLKALLTHGKFRLPYKISKPGKKEPRYYQTDAVDAVVSHLKKHQIAIIESCTASGKTLMILMLISRMLPRIVGNGQKILIVTHKPDLLNQIRKEFGRDAGAPCSYKYPNAETNLHMATIQELVSERKRNPEYFAAMLSRYGLLILDEVQHYPSGGFAAWSALAVGFMNAGTKVVGLSAKPSRFDRQPILVHQKKCLVCGLDIRKNVCSGCGADQPTYRDHIVYEYPLDKGVRDKYICEVSGIAVATDVAPREVTQKGTELDLRFNDAELAQRNKVILDTLLMCTDVRGHRQQVIMFVSRVAEAKRLSRKINTDRGLGVSKVVHGDLSTKDKEKIYNAFKRGKVNVIVNVEVTTEGVNLPNCNLVGIARATRSEELFWQMIGRGTRVSEGKDMLLVVDFLDNLELRHAKDVITLEVIRNGKTGIRGVTDGFLQDRDGFLKDPDPANPVVPVPEEPDDKPEKELAKGDIACIDYDYMVLWSKYMPFKEAREIVHNLVKSGDIVVDKRRPRVTWKRYAKSGQMSKDMPNTPSVSYAGMWNGWWDWYGVEERRWASRNVDKSSLPEDGFAKYMTDIRLEWTGPPRIEAGFRERYETETGETVTEQNGFNVQDGLFSSQKRSAEMKVYLSDLDPATRACIQDKLLASSWSKKTPRLRGVNSYRKGKWKWFIGGEEAWWVFVQEGIRLGINRIT